MENLAPEAGFLDPLPNPPLFKGRELRVANF